LFIDQHDGVISFFIKAFIRKGTMKIKVKIMHGLLKYGTGMSGSIQPITRCIHTCFAFLFFLVTLSSCNDKNAGTANSVSSYPDSLKLFTQLDSSVTGVHFRNDILEDEYTNAIVYEYTYNGAGVAIGDVNNDGLDDIFFTANQRPNRLYLNKSSLKFEDITQLSGTGGRPGCWKTGVTMADVNGDGLLDIYVCYSGDLPGIKRTNELLINKGPNNNGVPAFEDEASQWGVADTAYSTQASFFDYDKDGDLDMILVNHSPRTVDNLDEAYLTFLKSKKNLVTGVKLFQNTGSSFIENSTAAGIINNGLSFGLGVSTADVNNDNWPDIYLSNDYMAPDFLYINNKNGTFTDRIGEMVGYTSEFSMGSDIADFNNDGWNDIYTLDMLPEDNHRQKLLSSIDNYEFFELRNKLGLHPQFMRNMLHVNNGNGSFSEIAQLSGVSNTDWSWAPLFADFDNDGWKDLFVANGFVHDYTNLDFMKYMGDYLRQNNYYVQNKNLLELALKAPSSEVVNYLYQNNGDLTFKNMSAPWGIDKPSNSNGAAYADLDNDGDLDLVVNNTKQPAGIFRNNANKITGNHYLRLKLKGENKNTQAVGARIFVYCDSLTQTTEQVISRGYQSSVSPILHIGLGKSNQVDSLRIVWPSGKTQLLQSVAINSLLQLNEADAIEKFKNTLAKSTPLMRPLSNVIAYKHAENAINDFKRQPLLTSSLSYSGPCIAKGDINADGLEDLYIGGANGQSGKIYVQNKKGQFTETNQPVFVADAKSEDADACFADVDIDGDKDLYVSSGGYDSFLPNDAALQDRLYLNDGKGKFSKAANSLPEMLVSKGSVAAADVNADGHVDFFVGGRVIPGRYPETPQSFLLLNDGKGHFKNVLGNQSNALAKAGMISSAVFADFNSDKQPDLITAGEFMPIQIWINNKGQFTEQTSGYFNKPVYGCWNKIVVDDINNDGKPDIIAGNMGLNSQLKCSEKEPAELYYKDFDDNGSVDPILCYYIQGKSSPAVSRDELLDQMSTMRVKFTDYKSYADATLQDVFTKEELQGAIHLKATSFASTCFISSANSKYLQKDLPLDAQQSPIYAISVADVDRDGIKDIIAGGNVSNARLRFGYCRASKGQIFKGLGNGRFEMIPAAKSGLQINGDVRSMAVLNNTIFFGVNNAPLATYVY
jgi:enediyne biosynthesis protein E4